jgi:Flp pilus assembly protein TadD
MLLGRVYLRTLGDGQGQQAGDMLHAAIKEYEKIAQLKPGDLETRLLLGQLYGLDHESAKAEAEFKAAQKIDGSNEEVVLNMARLYSEQGDLEHAAAVISQVPASDRTGRMDFALARRRSRQHGRQARSGVGAHRLGTDGCCSQDLRADPRL